MKTLKFRTLAFIVIFAYFTLKTYTNLCGLNSNGWFVTDKCADMILIASGSFVVYYNVRPVLIQFVLRSLGIYAIAQTIFYLVSYYLSLTSESSIIMNYSTTISILSGIFCGIIVAFSSTLHYKK